MDFLTNLDNLIKDNKITRTELARNIGISEGTIRQWYNGKLPTLDKIIKLSEYFSISIDELVGCKKYNDIEYIYSTLDTRDKEIVDLIFDKYKNTKKSSDYRTG